MAANPRWRVPLLALAAIVLAAGITAANSARSAPRFGLLLETNTGRVLSVESGGIAAGAGIRAGDMLTAIDGLPLDGNPSVLGNLVPVSIRRHDVIGVRWLASPPAGGFWPGDLLLIVAAIFWLAGVSTTLLGQGGLSRYLFSLFALLVALALVSAYGLEPPIAVLRDLVAPAAFGAMTAYIWLQRALAGEPIGLDRSRLAVLLSVQAALLAVLVDAVPGLFGAASGPYLAAVAGLDLLLMLIAAHLRALGTAAADRSAPARRRRRLGLLIGVAAWLPALLLGWAPLMAGLLDHGYDTPWSPYIATISLVMLAITYPAVVARGDLFMLELAARRLAASLIAAVVLLSVALGVLHGIDHVFAPQGNDRLALAVAIMLLTVPAFDPLRRRLQRILEHRLGAAEAGYSGSLEAIGDRLLQALDEPGIAAALTGYAPALLGVTSIRAWLLGSDGRWLHFTPNGMGAPVPPGRETEGMPVMLGDGTALEQLPPRRPDLLHVDQPFAPSPRVAAEGVALCVPVCVGEEPRGLLLLGPRQSQDPYRRPERDAFALLSKQVAAALLFVDQFAELRRRNAELAQLTSRLARAREEERKHLSHELHDAVAQDLIAITRQLRRHQSGTVSEPIWQDMMVQAQEALTAIRRICNDLRPAILDMGLTSALRELVDRASSAPRPLTARLDIHGVELRLDEEREFALYRVCQEALANVVKHAGATDVTISVRYEGDAAEIEIEDNGRGFTAPERLEDIGGDRLGLLGMRERLADLGGLVRVESRPGQGTRVWARVPVGA